MSLPKKYFVETYGCQMNEHDSEKMSELLEQLGLEAVDSVDTADVVVINTCAIREKAEHKVYSSLGKLRLLKRENPNMIVVVAGCVAQQKQDQLASKFNHLDVVLGTHHISELPELIKRISVSRERIVKKEFVDNIQSLHIPAPGRGSSPVCSYVTIMQGCSNFCAYCVVPYARGREQSRKTEEIIEEVSSLASQGIREITLLGQNVNAYGKDLGNGTCFAGLLEKLSAIKDIKRIRFTTSHPRDFDSSLAEAIANLPHVCEHVHLPLQSGSDRVLRNMRRAYTLSEYLGKIDILRSKSPGCSITGDMIVGFPGESGDDFQQTIEALERIRFDQIFSFKFSPRPGTAAEYMSDQIPEEVKKARLAAVHILQDEITENYHRLLEGTVAEILIEGRSRYENQFYGRTRTNKIVNFETVANHCIGDVVQVKILRGLKHSLVGSLV